MVTVVCDGSVVVVVVRVANINRKIETETEGVGEARTVCKV